MIRCPARVLFALCVLSQAAVVGSGCHRQRYAAAPPPAVTDAASRRASADPALVSANNAFGFDLFGQLVRANPAKNVFVSPAGIALALQIVQNGARGDTLKGMAQTLHLSDQSAGKVNAANAALQAGLVSSDPQVQLHIANSLWLHRDRARILPAFVAANTTYYGSEIGDLADAPDAINAWASQHTDGKITSIVGSDNYGSMAAVVVNAVYFKGKWTMPFDALDTRPTPFTRLDGTSVDVPMMHQSGTIGYCKGAGFQAARLPYGTGRLSLLVVLPDRGVSWNWFLGCLSPDAISTWAANCRGAYGDIGLPRFQLEYAADLKAPLSTLGMGAAFDAGRADLTGIAPSTQGNIYIKDVKHKTFLKVDERGTEAAAVTTVRVMTLSAHFGGFVMTLDHPFFCALRDDKTGEILFMGCITDPTVSGD